MVRRLTNSIRPGVLASLLAKGEAQTSLHPLLHAGGGRTKPSTLRRRVKAMDEGHKVVGDGTSRRLHAVTGDTQPQEVKRMGVRASIRALKRGNARGAKGGRKVYVR
jgi:hypothetical protein